MKRIGVTLASLVCVAPLLAWQGPPQVERVYYDYVDEAGRLAGGTVEMPLAVRNDEVIPAWAVTLHGRAGTANRYKLVTVGDGYQTAQLGLYATHVQGAIDQLLSQEPFKNYASYFVVTRVDVVSIDSGVDNDPTQGVSKNTAMDMAFWCGGTERLLCVNVTKAQGFANNAAGGWDQVLAVGNTTKYGGAGYPSSNLGTLAGGNSSAAEIAIHELGHSMGDLADEYDYGGSTTYTGGEPSAVNASIYTAAQQTAQSRKWFRWIGENQAGWDGLVSSFEGCNYSALGIYRPTSNSKMRALFRPFNLVSAEALIGELYRVVSPIEAVAPATTTVLTGFESVSVTTMQPVNDTIAVQWYLDNQPITGATGDVLDLCSIRLHSVNHTLKVTVTDTTPWVRDPTLRANRLTKSKSWTVQTARCDADYDCNTFVNGDDFDFFMEDFYFGRPAADYDDNGFVNGDDFDDFGVSWVAGC